MQCPESNRQTKHSILAGPPGRSIAKTRDADALRQSSFDGRQDQPRCEERQRYRHIDLSNAAVLAHRDLVDRDDAGNDLIEPVSATCDRCVARVSARIGRASCGAADWGTMISRRRFDGDFFQGTRRTM